MNFLRVTITRMIYAALLLVAVLILNFTLMHLAPGDVADTIAQSAGGIDPEALEQIRQEYGLDKPFIIQLGSYIGRVLQFDLVAYRLQDEYRAECVWEDTSIFTARWVYCDDDKKLAEFRARNEDSLALDGGGHLAYLASSRVNLQLAEERWPEVTFAKTREH